MELSKRERAEIADMIDTAVERKLREMFDEPAEQQDADGEGTPPAAGDTNVGPVVGDATD